VDRLAFVTLRQLDRPAAGDPVGALVFFHGYFGMPEDFLAFLDKIDPERRFDGYLPQGPYLVQDGRSSWFDRGSTKPPEKQLAPVAEWLEGLPYPPERSGGFRNEIPLDLVRPLPPVAIAHERADDALPVDLARKGSGIRQRAGASVLYRETAIGHEIDQGVVPDLCAFLASFPRLPRLGRPQSRRRMAQDRRSLHLGAKARRLRSGHHR
jgi:predicted esterase